MTDLLDNYQQFVLKVCSDASKATDRDMLLTSALGLNDEAGEVAGLIKKHVYHGHDLDRTHLKKELGDIAWYLALGATAAGTSLTEVIEANMAKLLERYPGANFSTEKSLNRKEGDI